MRRGRCIISFGPINFYWRWHKWGPWDIYIMRDPAAVPPHDRMAAHERYCERCGMRQWQGMEANEDRE